MSNSNLIYYKDIHSRKIDWLWYPYIPFGKITIVQGDPGEGKTTFVLSLLSIMSNNGTLPCSDTIISGNAIYQNTEDDNADTIKPRLETHGANCANICFIDKAEGRLSLDDDELKNAVIKANAKILVLDPIQAFIGENIDMNRANAVRPRMNKLKELAESTGCAVILVGHLNKNSGGKANYRGLGSIDFSAATRSVLVIGRVADDPSLRVMAQQKNNLGPIGKSLAFTLNDGKVEWIGEYECDADELMSGVLQDKAYNKQTDAEDLLKKLLSDGEQLSKDILDAAQEEGISRRTLFRAKSTLGITARKLLNEWYWSLP